MIRSKISFMALEKCLTIQELFLHAILKTYLQHVQMNRIKLDENIVKVDRIFKQIISGEKNMKMVTEEKMNEEENNCSNEFDYPAESEIVKNSLY